MGYVMAHSRKWKRTISVVDGTRTEMKTLYKKNFSKISQRERRRNGQIRCTPFVCWDQKNVCYCFKKMKQYLRLFISNAINIPILKWKYSLKGKPRPHWLNSDNKCNLRLARQPRPAPPPPPHAQITMLFFIVILRCFLRWPCYCYFTSFSHLVTNFERIFH